jgi:hypothetical protein
MVPNYVQAEVKSDIPIQASFLKVKIIEDGKISEHSMVVSLTIATAIDEKGNQANWAIWDSVFIMPDSLTGGERVVLRADHYTHDNEIRNIKVVGNMASFDLFRSADRPVHIICIKHDFDNYEFRGTSTYYSDLLKRTIVEEWVLTDRMILPSKEVYGYPMKR